MSPVEHPQTDAPIPDDREKLRWEIEKLRAETDQIRRPAFRSPSTLLPIMTGLVAFVGAGFQYQWNQVKAERAAYQVEKAQDDLARLEEARAELTSSIDALTRNIDALEAENEKVSVRVSDTRAQLAKAQEGIRLAAASAATSPEAKQALTQVQGTVANLVLATVESEQARKEQASRLQTIRSGVAEVRSGEILMGSKQ